VAREPAAGAVEVGLRLRHRDAALQPQERFQEVHPAEARGHRIGGAQRHQHFHRPARLPEIGPHDADHRVGVAVERDGLAQDRRVGGEALLPEAVGQHRHARGA
jgi:hypothetical protein